MRVLLIPGYSGNPYLSELATALRALGVDVEGVGGLGPARPQERARLFARYDIVHVHWTHQYIEGRTRVIRIRRALSFLICVLVARLRGTRFVWTVHNVFAHDTKDVSLERRFNRALARLASRGIVHCPAARDEIATEYRLTRVTSQKFAVIPHGHYIDSYPRAITKDRARERLGLGTELPVFVCFGAIRHYKGLDALLDAFMQIESGSARLVIAGRPKSPGYARRISARAHAIPGVTTVLEFIPDEDVQVYMRAASVVVLPYEQTLTSGVAILAMSFGRAVIMPDLGCAGALLNQQAELLFTPGNGGALAQVMERALKVDLDELGARNLDRIQSTGWDSVAASTQDVYRAATAGSRPR